MMYNNRWLPFRLVMPISLVVLLFFTCCVKSAIGLPFILPFRYLSQGNTFKSGNSKAHYIKIDCSKVDWTYFDYAKINWSNIDCSTVDWTQVDCSKVDWPHVDCSTFDLIKMGHRSNLLCKAIDSNNISMLQILLKEIKSNPIKYPPKKIIELIAYSRSGEGKMPLLIRAINRGGYNRSHNHAPILELLFEALRHYSLSTSEQVFSVQFGPGKYTIIHQAIHLSNFNMLVYLIEKYIKIKQDQGMDIAAALSSLKEVLSIVNKTNQTPLEMAFSDYNFLHSENKLGHEIKLQLDVNPQENLDIVRYLLKYTDLPSEILSTLTNTLHNIAERGHTNMLKNIMRVLIEKFKKINHFGYKEIICKMVNLPDNHGRTPLHYAVIQEVAKKHSPDTVEYLMNLGANPTSYDENGISPLFIAIAFNNPYMVELLLDKNFSGNQFLKSNINNQGSAGLTPLNWSIFPRDKLITGSIARLFSKVASCNSGIDASIPLGTVSVDLDIVQRLLDAGSDPFIPDERGNQPLHRAVQRGEVNKIEMCLLKDKRDPLPNNKEGDTALDILIKQACLTDRLGHGNGPVIKMFLLILDHLLRTAKPVLDAKPYQRDKLDLYMGLHKFFKTNSYKYEPTLIRSYLNTYELQPYGISNAISYSRSEKRLLDGDDFSINPNKKRSKMNVQGSFTSSSGRTQGT